MNKLALTTNQIKLGLLVDTQSGPQFYPLAVAALLCAVWLAVLGWRLALDIVEAAGFLRRLVWANVAGLWWRLALPLRLDVCYG
jgi:hypothetical protein